jgi:hypothetical protein
VSRSVAIAGLVLVVGFAQSAQAWNATGHMAIAAMAYQELPGDTRQKVNAILRQHPRFAEWQEQRRPESGTSIELYVFLRASTWPDEIRDVSYTYRLVQGAVVLRDGKPVVDPQRQAEQAAYDHRNWHFTDYPLVPPALALEARPAPADDVIFGILSSRRSLAAAATSGPGRAAALSWLIHLIADIHQPEHCATLFGPAFPYGDKGGNWFYVKTAAEKPFKLHAFWDCVLGSSDAPEGALDLARRLKADRSLARGSLSELAEDTTVESWALESRTLAITTVYGGGALRPAPAVFVMDTTTGRPALQSVDLAKAQDLPPNYRSEAIAAARRRFALAGYRLRDALVSAVR